MPTRVDTTDPAEAKRLADARRRIAPRDRVKPSARKCGYCGEIAEPHDETWQQWQCPCCGSWNDKPARRVLRLKARDSQ